MNTGNVVGTGLGIKLVNGKFKPKYNKFAYIVLAIMFFIFLGFIAGFIYGIINLNIEVIVMCFISIVSLGYLLLITPYTQSSKNYYIEFESQDSLSGFKLKYKNKLVFIKYIIDNEGKIAFADNNSKLKCISYADGSKMLNITKYKIMNYFSKWLHDNNLMSKQITLSFE